MTWCSYIERHSTIARSPNTLSAERTRLEPLSHRRFKRKHCHKGNQIRWLNVQSRQMSLGPTLHGYSLTVLRPVNTRMYSAFHAMQAGSLLHIIAQTLISGAICTQKDPHVGPTMSSHHLGPFRLFGVHSDQCFLGPP